MADGFDRFRSFAERYVISRAASFRAGHEEEDGYMATLQARTIYNNIQVQSESPTVCDNRPLEPFDRFGNGSVGAATQAPGATGAIVRHSHPSSTGRSNPHPNVGHPGHPYTPTQKQLHAIAQTGASKHNSPNTDAVAEGSRLHNLIHTIMGRESK